MPLSPCPAPEHPQFPFLALPHNGTMAAPISVRDFVRQAQEDLSSPTTSTFSSHMGRCKATASSVEEVSRARGWGGGTPRDAGAASSLAAPWDLRSRRCHHGVKCPKQRFGCGGRVTGISGWGQVQRCVWEGCISYLVRGKGGWSALAHQTPP